MHMHLQVEAIYDRIVSSEIVMRDESVAAAARGQQQQQQQRHRLAAALGWARRGGWDKQRGADAERRAMMEMAERELAKGMLSGNVWHSAQHAEHVRPMLQVGGFRELASAWQCGCGGHSTAMFTVLRRYSRSTIALECFMWQ